MFGGKQDSSVMAAVLPEVGMLRQASGGSGRKLVLILAGVGILVATLALAIFWLLGKELKAAHQGATNFGAALVRNDPSAAPSGAAAYINGMRTYFGPVSSAVVIGSHNRGVNTGDEADTRNYYVVEMLLGTRRGPAAVELEFDNHSIGSDRISGVHELKPGDAPGISPTERSRLAAAFAARGGKPADDAALMAAPAAHVHAPSVPAAASSQLSKAAQELRCVQHANGDVAKLQKCTS